MWESDYKESWAIKNWCFWTMVLDPIGSQSRTQLKRLSMHARMCLWERANAMSLYQELTALVLECLHSTFIVSMRIWLHWRRGQGEQRWVNIVFSCRASNLACSEEASINIAVWSIWCHQAVCTPDNKGLYQHVWRQYDADTTTLILKYGNLNLTVFCKRKSARMSKRILN